MIFHRAVLGVFFLASLASADPVPSSRAFYDKLAVAALSLTKSSVTYDGAYFVIPYPNGDVPADKGVCTDVVVRAYRALGIDLQKEVHEDMSKHFALYPKDFGAKRPDRNIDHRRVPNLRTFFSRHGESLPPSMKPGDYLPGDLVTWDLGRGLKHIGVVSDRRAGLLNGRKQIVHNIGAGQVLEDVLFAWPITGHYRYSGH